MRTSAVYLVESQFMEDQYKFFRCEPLLYRGSLFTRIPFILSGVLSAMSAMVNLEIPWINVMSKMDLVTENAENPSQGARNGVRGRRNIARFATCWPFRNTFFELFQNSLIISRYLDPDPLLLMNSRGQGSSTTNPRFHALNQAVVQLVRSRHCWIFCSSSKFYLPWDQIEDHPLVSFLPMDLTSEDSLENVISHIDYTMQYGEDEEPKEVCDIFYFLSSHSAPMSYLHISHETWTKVISRVWNESGWVSPISTATKYSRCNSIVRQKYWKTQMHCFDITLWNL
jgi:GPN-loop GTPase